MLITQFSTNKTVQMNSQQSKTAKFPQQNEHADVFIKRQAKQNESVNKKLSFQGIFGSPLNKIVNQAFKKDEGLELWEIKLSEKALEKLPDKYKDIKIIVNKGLDRVHIDNIPDGKNGTFSVVTKKNLKTVDYKILTKD